MKLDVTVARFETFTSKKGNKCMVVYVVEKPGDFPFKILVFDKDQVQKPLHLGDHATLGIRIQNDLTGMLDLTW